MYMYMILVRINDDQRASGNLHKDGRLILNKILVIKDVQMVWPLQLRLRIIRVHGKKIYLYHFINYNVFKKFQ
jgi:hypothetical protein